VSPRQDKHQLDPEQVRVGLPVAARYINGDLSWYRARVTAMDAGRDEYDIFFVDYAHAQVNTLHQLRLLPPAVLRVPPMAIPCRLFGALS